MAGEEEGDESEVLPRSNLDTRAQVQDSVPQVRPIGCRPSMLTPGAAGSLSPRPWLPRTSLSRGSVSRQKWRPSARTRADSARSCRRPSRKRQQPACARDWTSPSTAWRLRPMRPRRSIAAAIPTTLPPTLSTRRVATPTPQVHHSGKSSVRLTKHCTPCCSRNPEETSARKEESRAVHG